MNFQNITYFIAVAEERNITKAADRLYVSQQALSSQISRLEDELGCTLFERRTPLELTYPGKIFLESCLRIMDIHRQTITELDDISKSRKGELRIGISYTRGQAILPLLLPEFSRSYPQIELSVVEGSSAELEENLAKGDIDVMIGFAPFNLESACTTPLMKEHLYLVLPQSLMNEHFGSKANEVFDEYRKNHDITLFRDFPFVLLKKGDRIRTTLDKAFSKAGMKPRIKLETSNIQTAYALSAEGMGLTVCPELYLRNRYVESGHADSELRRRILLCPFFSDERTDTIAIGYNRDRYLSANASAFMDMALSVFSSGSQK